MTANEIAQWVIDNRYPRNEKEKVSDLEMYHYLVESTTDERMSSGGLEATTFRKAQRLKRELILNVNKNPAITYTHCCVYVAV